MNRIVTIAVVAVVLGAAALTGGIALAGGGDDGDGASITGTALDRASAAALAHTGGGRVTETEAGDEEGAYEVEVTLENGSEVDVHLDRSFNVIDSSADQPGQDDNDQSGQDDGEQGDD